MAKDLGFHGLFHLYFQHEPGWDSVVFSIEHSRLEQYLVSQHTGVPRCSLGMDLHCVWMLFHLQSNGMGHPMCLFSPFIVHLISINEKKPEQLQPHVNGSCVLSMNCLWCHRDVHRRNEEPSTAPRKGTSSNINAEGRAAVKPPRQG